MKTTKPHFTMSLDMINDKACYFCGGFGDYRDRKEKSEPSAPGDFMQHETKYIHDLGHIKIFECAKCHNLIFFRSHFEEEVELFE